jgi:hypothetical protein
LSLQNNFYDTNTFVKANGEMDKKTFRNQNSVSRKFKSHKVKRINSKQKASYPFITKTRPIGDSRQKGETGKSPSV